MLNGTPVIDFKGHSTKEYVGEFFKIIREKNPLNKIAILCDNFTFHRAHYTIQCAKEHGIILIILPKYSSDLNPIEFIWKSIKRVISRNFVHDIDHMRSLIQYPFPANASKLSFAGYWIERFLGGADWFKKLGS